jgi:hypothetical protein
MEELHAAICALPAEKAPGPDDFIGHFFRTCWEIIDEDLFAAVMQLSEHGGASMKLLNAASIVLIPKKTDARSVVDY